MKILLQVIVNHNKKHLISIFFTILLLFSGLNANATLIDFDNQGLTGPCYISGPPYDSPDMVNVNVPSLGENVVFDNGRIFSGLSGFSANTSSIYATFDYGNYDSKILRISFPTTVNNYSLQIYNGIFDYAIEYQVRDDALNSENVIIQPNSDTSFATVVVTNSNVSQIEVEPITLGIALGAPYDWSFAIDNISFDTTAVIPEPASLFLLGSGLLGLLVLRRK